MVIKKNRTTKEVDKKNEYQQELSQDTEKEETKNESPIVITPSKNQEEDKRVSSPDSNTVSREEVNQKENLNLDVELGAKAEDKSLHVVFQATDGSLRFYKLSEIPFYEDAFAMTVHKSQGSGFNHVMLIMPDKEVAILTRELIYTGITRTKNKLVILGKENIIRKSLVQKTFRYSGLYQRYNDKIQQKVGV
jgi:hypothetical protein